MLHGCLDSGTEKGVKSDCHVMGFDMAADVTSSGMAWVLLNFLAPAEEHSNTHIWGRDGCLGEKIFSNS